MNLFIDLFVQLSLDNRENWYDTPIGKDPLMNQENLQIMEFLLSSKFTCGDKQVVSTMLLLIDCKQQGAKSISPHCIYKKLFYLLPPTLVR